MSKVGDFQANPVSGWPRPPKVRAFQKAILGWKSPENRHMPWVGEKKPYRVWLSEVILQQTTVDQGRDYYLRISKAFPKVADLARASEDDILRYWQGLGYYTRARNMLRTAKLVMDQYGGRFPKDYDTLVQLPGIGSYTAAAIASFAGNQPCAVVDGNVTRVLTRYFGITEPVDKPATKRQVQALADVLLDADHPGAYNQALMNFGSMQCQPRNPDCTSCPLRRTCQAHLNNTVQELPRKARTVSKRNRYFNYLVIRVHARYVLKKRTGRDIWKGLYEFPLVETRQPVGLSELRRHKEWPSWLDTVQRTRPLTFRQVLSHQVIHGRFFELTMDKIGSDMIAVEPKKLREVALPRIIAWYFASRNLL